MCAGRPGGTRGVGSCRRSGSRPRAREDEAELVRLSCQELATQDADGRGREVDAPPGGARLHRPELALVDAVLDDQSLRFEVDVAVAQGEQLALAQTRERGDITMFPYGARFRRELLDLAPPQEAHLVRLAAGSLDAEDALVDEVPALLRVREDLLEQPERELGLPRYALRKRGDVVLDRGRTDLVKRIRREDLEVLPHLVRALSVEARTRSA